MIVFTVQHRRILAYLGKLQSKVDTLQRLQAETQRELDALLPSALDKAFRGGVVGIHIEPCQF